MSSSVSPVLSHSSLYPSTPASPPCLARCLTGPCMNLGIRCFGIFGLLPVFLYHSRYFPFLCLSESTVKLSLITCLSHFPGRMISFSSGFYSIWFYFYHSIHHHLSLVVLVFSSNQEQDLGKDWLYHSVHLLLELCFLPSRHAVKICWIKVVSRNKNKNLYSIAWLA